METHRARRRGRRSEPHRPHPRCRTSLPVAYANRSTNKSVDGSLANRSTNKSVEGSLARCSFLAIGKREKKIKENKRRGATGFKSWFKRKGSNSMCQRFNLQIAARSAAAVLQPPSSDVLARYLQLLLSQLQSKFQKKKPTKRKNRKQTLTKKRREQVELLYEIELRATLSLSHTAQRKRTRSVAVNTHPSPHHLSSAAQRWTSARKLSASSSWWVSTTTTDERSQLSKPSSISFLSPLSFLLHRANK